MLSILLSGISIINPGVSIVSTLTSLIPSTSTLLLVLGLLPSLLASVLSAA